MTTPVSVTDHALLRYLQRARGVDVEGLRSELQDRLTKFGEAQ